MSVPMRSDGRGQFAPLSRPRTRYELMPAGCTTQSRLIIRTYEATIEYLRDLSSDYLLKTLCR